MDKSDLSPNAAVYSLLAAGLILTSLTPVTAGNSPYNIEVTEDYVSATAKPSVGGYGYSYGTHSFVNYCPYSKTHGCLESNPKGVAEGEWTCKLCGADYCMYTGKEKYTWSDVYLLPYEEPVTGINHGLLALLIGTLEV